MRFFLFAVISIVLLPLSGLAQLRIAVFSQSDKAISDAYIMIQPGNFGVLTDAKGRAVVENLDDGEISVYVQALGFESIQIDTVYFGNLRLNIHLRELVVNLGEIETSAQSEPKEQFSQLIQIDQNSWQRNLHSTLAEGLSGEAGLHMLNTGTGISQPVIRGMRGNRIGIEHFGSRFEAQQWGQEHGIEIDAYDMDGIEVIKGPAALAYGGGNIGGVIRIKPPTVPELNKLTAQSIVQYASNNRLFGQSHVLALNKRNWFLETRISLQEFGNFSLSADSFRYNGFVYPLANNRLTNTGGEVSALRTTIGRRHANYLSRLTFSTYQFKGGFFPGAIGIPGSYLLQTDADQRSISVPYQETVHKKINFDHIQFLGQNHLHLNLSWQDNLRSEYSWPESHRLPPSAEFNLLAQQFNLQTLSGDLRYEMRRSDAYNLDLGVNFQTQKHQIDGFDRLLAPYNRNLAGAYAIITSERKGRSAFQGSIRFDHGHNAVYGASRFIYNSTGDIQDSLQIPQSDKRFNGLSASVAWNYQWPEHMLFRLNLSRSYRVVAPNESSSNGVHHGTFRHEEGNPELNAETGYHLNGGIIYRNTSYHLALDAFASYFSNYIYLRPSGRFSTLPEAGQVYEYVQVPALYGGLELSHSIRAGEHFEFNQNADIVLNRNLESGYSLAFTPPFRLRSMVQWHRHYNGVMEQARFQIEHVWVARQEFTDQNEKSTPGYQIYNVSTGATFRKYHRTFEFTLAIENALNTAYLNHLSRYRILSLPEPGRNLKLTLRIPLFELRV